MSSFVDGIQAIMLKQADPAYAESKQLMSSFTDKLKSEALEAKATTVSNIAPLLAQAIANGEDAVIIDAYRSIIKSASAN